MRSVRPKPRQELPEWAKQRIDKLSAELEVAEARVKALKATLSTDPDPLLVDVANAFLLADLASESGQGQNLDRIGRRSAETPMPGADTRNARSARRKLRRTIENAVQAFNNAADHQWRPPVLSLPKVRCVHAGCPYEGIAIPKHVGPRNEIEISHCQNCGSQLSGL